MKKHATTFSSYIIACSIVISYLALFILGIVEVQHWKLYKYNDSGCLDKPDDGLSLKIWIGVDGVMTLVSTFSTLIAVYISFCKGRSGKIVGAIAIILNLFVGSFMWTIAGVTQILRYSKSCRTLDFTPYHIVITSTVMHAIFFTIHIIVLFGNFDVNRMNDDEEMASFESEEHDSS